MKEVLGAALQRDPASRGDFIREASDGNPALRDEVLRLLQDIETRRIGTGRARMTDWELLEEMLPETTAGPLQDMAVAARHFAGTARFDVRRSLGSGAFGTVYECYDRDQQQSVAVKVLRQTDPAFLYRFKREFRALVDVRHANLVQLYELFGEDQFWFFSMEFVRGVTFRRYVEPDQTEDTSRWAPGNFERLREALRQLSEGVLALHARGILHRDIKPANVLVPSDGRVRLLDFGLVHELELSGPHSALLAGTPAYMAPERLALHPAGTASDWYSVGVMVFEALTGALPSTDQRVDPHWPSSIVAQLADVPADLKQLCADLLNPDAGQRPTGAEIRRRLDAPTPTGPRAVAEAGVELVVGREPELARLTALLERTRQGHTVVVNLSGQSGIGKSTVLRTFRRRLTRTDPDVVMLIGRCHENESVPFKALDDLVDHLSQYLKALPSPEAEVLAPRDAASLIRMFPVLAQVDAIVRGRQTSLDVVDAEELQRRAFGSLQDLLARLAERKTLLLAIDDLQWGDLDSAAFLRALLGGPSPPCLLLIAAYRAEDATTSPFLQSWRTDLAGASSLSIEYMELGELTTSESQHLAVLLLQSYAGISEIQTAESIVRESGGSPFLIEHFVRSIRWDRDDQAGFTIRQAVADRFRELPERTRRLLETLAIAGQPLTEAVACSAAEWDAADRPALLTLATEHFVRVRDTHAPRQIEIYHDRLREIIIASMVLPTRQQRHEQLARALERDGNTDPAAISTHWREAGHPDRASSYAVAAGDRASNALAFERAAEWYRLALETGSWTPPQAIELQRKLAAALAFAGRGVSAAEVYLKVAALAGPRDRVDLQRLAAEQLLRAGHADQGLVVLEGLAQELGIWLAPKRWQQFLSLALHRARAALPAVGVGQRSPSDRADRQLMMLDVYWSFWMGLTEIDPIRAIDFHARHRVLAARVGDPTRIALSLAVEASNQAAFRGRDSSRSRDLMAKARVLCAGTPSPEALGFIATAEAMCASMTGDWSRTLRLAEEADRFLAEHCSGVAWERATSIALRMDAAFHLGEWATVADYSQRFPGRIEDARARGDVHAIALSILEGTLRFLIADEPVRAEQFVRDALTVLASSRFLMPNMWAFGMQVFIALYTGDGNRAWTLADSLWRELPKSHFLRLEHAAIEALDVRARAAICVAAMNNGSEHHVNEAVKCARKLARKHPRWATALSLLLRAGVANVRRERQPTLDFLQRAETEFRACEMAQYVATCQYRRGTLIGGEEGRALIAAAVAWAKSQRVVNHARVFDMFAPGRWAGVRSPEGSERRQS